jgi:hypothetical protein
MPRWCSDQCHCRGNASPPPVSQRRQTIAPHTYVSAYRVSAAPTVARLDFEPFEFLKTTCCANEDGALDHIASDRPETILIAKGWQRFIGGNDNTGSYLGTGHSKYAFKVGGYSYLGRLLISRAARASTRAVIMRSFKADIITRRKQTTLPISGMS